MTHSNEDGEVNGGDDGDGKDDDDNGDSDDSEGSGILLSVCHHDCVK